MENKFRVRISCMFHNSCKSRDDVDAVEKSPFLSRLRSMPAAAPLPKHPPRPSLIIHNTCIASSEEVSRFVPMRNKNRASSKKPRPKSPVEQFACSHFYDRKEKKKKKKKKNKAKALPSFDDNDFFCGDDKKEEDDDERTTGTPFSSMSLSSSESSEKLCRRRTTHKRTEVGERVGVRGSFAVAKKSRDPYGDFRKSMITERWIFEEEEEEMEQLLLCFFSLNSRHHQEIIIKVFNDIWNDDLH